MPLPPAPSAPPTPTAPSPPAITHHTLSLSPTTSPLPYTAEAGWLHLRERDRATAELFFTYYCLLAPVQASAAPLLGGVQVCLDGDSTGH
jgi:hypothetical protein